jgi:hypothetical protein
MILLGTGGGGVSNDKGYFATEAALILALPVGQDGWFATVGTTDTVWVWDSGSSAWVDTYKAPDLSGVVPYTGATNDLDMGAFDITAGNLSGTNTGDQVSSDFDHGGLTGLTGDDHTQYVLADGTRNITGEQTFDDGIVNEGDLSVSGSSEFNDEAYFNELVEMYSGLFAEGGVELDGTLNHGGGAFLSSGTTGATPASGAGTRMMWVPAKSAFRAGYVNGIQWNDSNIGEYSFAAGANATVRGEGSSGFGSTPYVTGDYSTAFGYNCSVNGDYAVAFGKNTNARGYASTVFGFQCEASGSYATCGGTGSEAEGSYSTCIGSNCYTEGIASVALGGGTTATGNYSFAAGYNCEAGGQYTTVLGYNAYADIYCGFAQGGSVTAEAQYGRCFGNRAISRLEGGEAIGNGYFTKKADAQTVNVILRGSGSSGATVSLDTPTTYTIPTDTTIVMTATFNWRADDGASACAVRRVLAEYDGTTMTMSAVQTIGTDIDDDGMIDEIEIYDAGDGEIGIDVTDAYGDDFGVVCNLDIIENAFLKPST